MVPLLLEGPSHLVHCRTDPHVEVGYLVEEEGLEELHLALHIPQVALIDLGQDTSAGVVDGGDALIFDIENLPADGQLEVFQLPLMDDLPV